MELDRRQRGERGHRRREQQHYDESEQRGRQILHQHRGHEPVVVAVRHFAHETRDHAAHEIRSAADDGGKQRGDHRALPYRRLVLYGVELVYGLRHAPFRKRSDTRE